MSDVDWQIFRRSLHGLVTAEKLDRLHQYLMREPNRPGEVRVANYINALRRGGLLNEHYEVTFGESDQRTA